MLSLIPSPARPRRRAFTIVEVMIAGTVMALAITTAITTMQSAFLALDSARNTTLASQILQGEIEKLRLLSWEALGKLQPTGPEPTKVEIDPVITRRPNIGNRFALTRDIDPIGTSMMEITMTITWRGYDGRTHERFYKTYYAKEGLYDYFSN